MNYYYLCDMNAYEENRAVQESPAESLNEMQIKLIDRVYTILRRKYGEDAYLDFLHELICAHLGTNAECESRNQQVSNAAFNKSLAVLKDCLNVISSGREESRSKKNVIELADRIVESIRRNSKGLNKEYFVFNRSRSKIDDDPEYSEKIIHKNTIVEEYELEDSDSDEIKEESPRKSEEYASAAECFNALRDIADKILENLIDNQEDRSSIGLYIKLALRGIQDKEAERVVRTLEIYSNNVLKLCRESHKVDRSTIVKEVFYNFILLLSYDLDTVDDLIKMVRFRSTNRFYLNLWTRVRVKLGEYCAYKANMINQGCNDIIITIPVPYVTIGVDRKGNTHEFIHIRRKY